MSVVREYADRHGVADRFDFLPGNLRDVDFGADRYDLAMLGNIVYSKGEESPRERFRRLARASRPGGRIALVDMIPANDRTGPVYPLPFAPNMLVHTEARGYLHADRVPTVASGGGILRGTPRGYRPALTADCCREGPLVTD